MRDRNYLYFYLMNDRFNLNISIIWRRNQRTRTLQSVTMILHSIIVHIQRWFNKRFRQNLRSNNCLKSKKSNSNGQKDDKKTSWPYTKTFHCCSIDRASKCSRRKHVQSKEFRWKELHHTSEYFFQSID